MPRVIVEIDNMKEVLEELLKMPEEGKTKLHQAVNKGAEKLHPLIQAAVKRGDSENGHHLKDAIRLRKAKPKKSAYQSADIVGGKGKQVDYGFHAEVGTKKMKGRSWFRNTTDANAEDISNTVVDELLRILGV
jgi:HK97 gp10 family phage protein